MWERRLLLLNVSSIKLGIKGFLLCPRIIGVLAYAAPVVESSGKPLKLIPWASQLLSLSNILNEILWDMYSSPLMPQRCFAVGLMSL